MGEGKLFTRIDACSGLFWRSLLSSSSPVLNTERPLKMPPATFTGVVTKCGVMNKTVTVTVSRMATHKKTGKVRRRRCRRSPCLTNVAAGIVENEKVSHPRRVERCALRNYPICASSNSLSAYF